MINSLIRKELKGSIQRKITIGFSFLLVLLSIVSFFGIRGIRHLSKINESTNAVHELLDVIYKVRLSEKNLVMSEDTNLVLYIDSLSTEMNNILLKINQNKMHEKAEQLLEPMLEYITDFNKNYKIYIELISSKKNLESKLDSFFYAVDNIKNNSALNAKYWIKNHPEDPVIVLNDLNYIHSNILNVRYKLRDIGLSTDFKPLLDSLSESFDQMYAFTYVLERTVKQPVLKRKVAILRNALREYEKTMMRYVQLVQDMMVVVKDLRQSGKRMQEAARKAADIQAVEQRYWSQLSLNFLVVIVIMSIFGGGAIFIFFFRRIALEEKIRENIEHEIEENRRLLDDIISNSISLIYVKTLEGKYSLVNQNWKKEMKIPEETEVTGHYDYEFFPRELVDKWRETDLKVIQHNKPLISEEEYSKDGETRYYLSNKFPIHDKKGRSVAVCGMSTDITDLKNALKELEKSRENYRNIVSNVPGIVYTCKYDDSRTMLFLSSGFEKITGFSRVNFIDGIQTYTNLIIPEDREKVIDTIRNAVSRNQSFEIEYRIEDAEGNVKWLHEKGMAITKGDVTEIVLQGVIIDVTDQMNAITEVMVRDRFLQGVADAVRELLIGNDTLKAISKSLRIVGYSAMVDSAFIFRNEISEGNETLYTSHLFEWHKNSIEPVKRNKLKHISYEDISSRWYFTLKDKNLISGNRDEFEEDEQNLFEWLELESMLLVPIFTRDNFWGFIGFGREGQKMEWVDSHKAIFKAYAVTLGIIIAKEMDAALLKEAKESAEAATRMKSDFLARMSHEIRTPMNAIVGWTHLAIEKSRDDTNIEYLKRVQSGAKSLLGIINDILDFSKIEAGKLTIEEIPFDLEKVFSDMSDMVSYRAFKKGIEYVYNIHPDVPLNVIGDPLRVGQILINLVNNAVKFTDEGYVMASVRVNSIKGDVAELLFEVKDTGIGIKPEQQKALFESFTQADVSTTRKFGGTGLGLAICKRLTDLMGGKIWVESEYGVGSKFSFIIPLKVQPEQKRDKLELPEGIKNNRVLVALFNSETKKTLMEMLTRFGFVQECVDTPDEAKNKLEVSENTGKYTFVIIDWPVENPTTEAQVVDLVKSNRKRKIPFILSFSAFYESKKLDSLLKKSGVWQLNKPFNYSTLYDTIMLVYGMDGTRPTLYKHSLSHYLNELKSLKNVKVLLVEDNEANRMIGVEMLGLGNVSVDVAENGKVAVEKISKPGGTDAYDLVLMDIQMPVMDGYQAAKQISKIAGAEKLPVVALTADTVGDAKQKYLSVGMVDMLSKPIEPDELYRKVVKWVKYKREIERESSEPADANAGNETKVIGAEQENAEDNIKIKGLDVETGIKRFANRWDFYKRLLERFYSDHVVFYDKLKEELEEGDKEKISRMLHSFKGITGSVAAEKLYPLAIELEDAFNSGKDTFEELLERAMKELDELLNELKINKYLDIK
ncbi:MAG: response regulator [Chlorobi bacterium]|nr:response regulator [Chlorobiota bacterium]